MIRRLRALALRKGVLGDSGPFLALWILLVGARLLRRVAAREPEVVYQEELAPGERLVVSHLTETHR